MHAASRAYASHRAADIYTMPCGAYNADRNSAAHFIQWVTAMGDFKFPLKPKF